MPEHKRDARKTIEDLEIERRLARAGAAASHAAQQAVTTVGGFARDHRGQAHQWLDHAEGEIDRVTGGRAHGVVARVRSGLAAGVDVVADQGDPKAESPGDDEGPGEGAPSDPAR